MKSIYAATAIFALISLTSPAHSETGEEEVTRCTQAGKPTPAECNMLRRSYLKDLNLCMTDMRAQKPGFVSPQAFKGVYLICAAKTRATLAKQNN